MENNFPAIPVTLLSSPMIGHWKETWRIFPQSSDTLPIGYCPPYFSCIDVICCYTSKDPQIYNSLLNMDVTWHKVWIFQVPTFLHSNSTVLQNPSPIYIHPITSTPLYIWLMMNKDAFWYYCHVFCHMKPATCNLPPSTSHISPVTSQLSPVTCQLSPVTCHLSHDTYYMSLAKFGIWIKYIIFYYI